MYLRRRQQGMTLIESIVAMVLMAVAMVTLFTLLYPSIYNSAAPNYQVRAIELGQSMMSQILAREFDHWSDRSGGAIRCGESGANNGNPDTGNSCTAPESLGIDSAYGETSMDEFNDVDDFIGCWYATNAQAKCAATGLAEYSMQSILSADMSGTYANFYMTVQVFYDENLDGVDDSTIGTMKRITVTIYAGRYGPYSLVAYRGNY